MKHFVISGVVAAAAFVSVGSPIQAQAYNPFQIGAAAGVAIPTGDFGNDADLGYNVTFAVGYKPQFTPVGVRLEAAYNQMGISGGGGNFNIPAFTGNLIFGLPIAMASPYVIGGAGLYRTNVDIQGLGSGGENHFGFNIGGGIKVPFSSSFETFVEARYNRVTLDQGNISFVPITVGIMF
ncbi:MAG TPA: outer membrane beta-barrel protein [Gemmatimonadaceae bacterium]|nr:outer membrane beta-barrel protein [Gemmatimonadaceae bacterium]